MRYSIRRISLSRMARVGCALGWLATLPLAMCLAGIIVLALLRVQQALQQLEPLTVSLFGQDILRIDWLDVLRLQPVADQLAQWTNTIALTFTFLALALTLMGSGLVLLIGLLVGSAYNLLGRAGWGVVVELAEEPAEEPASQTGS